MVHLAIHLARIKCVIFVDHASRVHSSPTNRQTICGTVECSSICHCRGEESKLEARERRDRDGEIFSNRNSQPKRAVYSFVFRFSFSAAVSLRQDAEQVREERKNRSYLITFDECEKNWKVYAVFLFSFSRTGFSSLPLLVFFYFFLHSLSFRFYFSPRSRARNEYRKFGRKSCSSYTRNAPYPLPISPRVKRIRRVMYVRQTKFLLRKIDFASSTYLFHSAGDSPRRVIIEHTGRTIYTLYRRDIKASVADTVAP